MSYRSRRNARPTLRVLRKVLLSLQPQVINRLDKAVAQHPAPNPVDVCLGEPRILGMSEPCGKRGAALGIRGVLGQCFASQHHGMRGAEFVGHRVFALVFAGERRFQARILRHLHGSTRKERRCLMKLDLFPAIKRMIVTLSTANLCSQENPRTFAAKVIGFPW